MELIKCKACGSNDVIIKDGFCICQYCFSKHRIDTESSPFKLEENLFTGFDDFVFSVKGVEFKMVKVAGGSFWMGADNGYRTRKVSGFLGFKKTEEYWDCDVQNYDCEACSNESPVHKVFLGDYYLGETVVTQSLWKAVMGTDVLDDGSDDYNPEEDDDVRGDALPALVSWEKAQAFIRELNKQTGKTFRLPTEAEWEYAAKGGNQSKGYKYSGSDEVDDVAWCEGYSHERWIYPVKGKLANELGLYDMSGNVWELCNDGYGSYSSEDQTNPKGEENNEYKVVRGGSNTDDLTGTRCRVSSRCEFYYGHFCSDTYGYGYVGFRLALSQ